MNLEVPQNLEAEDARLKRLRNEFREPPQIHPERREEIENLLELTAAHFNGFGKEWYLAGGLSLELAEGEMLRDHQDIDTVVPEEFIQNYWVYARQSGYSFFTHENKELSSIEDLQEQIQKEGNAVLQAGKDTQTDLRVFEVIFLRKGENGEGVVGAYGTILPLDSYLSAREYKVQSGSVIPLTPREIVLMHKFVDGRQRDFNDIRKHLPSFSVDERQRLSAYLKEARIEFVIGERSTSDVDELVQLANESTDSVFNQSIGELTRDQTTYSEIEFNDTIDKLYDAFQSAKSRDEFDRAVKNIFGDDFASRRSIELDQIAEYLFSGERPSHQELWSFVRQVVQFDEYVQKEISSKLQEVKRWTVRSI